MSISTPTPGAGLSCRLLVALFALVASLAGGEASPADNSRRIEDATDWSAYLARHDLVWQQLPTNWSQAPHCGNAMLGSMLFQTGNAITLQIHRADVRDHRDNSHGWTAYSRPRFRIGDFRLMPVGKITGGAWRLDLWNAEVTGTIRTDRGEITFRHFVHADEMAIVTELHPSAGEAGCRWEWFPQRAETGRGDYPKTAAEVDRINTFGLPTALR